ncbi:hypothetical protein Trydic_g1323 [Trypoxylus dichotomus]
MYTSKLMLLFLSTFSQNVLTEVNVLKISGRNDNFGKEKTIAVPIEVIYEDRKLTALSPEVAIVRPAKAEELHNLASANPVLATLLLSYNLHISPDSPGFNHPQHLPINPYVALLLSHYGRYIPLSGSSSGGRGIYGYTAANNYHNNLPFGSYKIYTDRDV